MTAELVEEDGGDNALDLEVIGATLEDISNHINNLDVTLEEIVAEMKETNVHLSKIADYFEAAKKAAEDDEIINSALGDGT
jgi:hypothetical protein